MSHYVPVSSLSPPSLPALNLSQHHHLFQWVGSLHQVTKYWSCSTSPSIEYLGLIFFRMDWLDLLAVQGTLRSLLQHHSSKASILWRSAFFMVQLSHLYMTIGKIITLTIWILVSKVRSLLFNKLSRFVIAFLLRSKCLLISWLQSLSGVILNPPKIKFVTDSMKWWYQMPWCHLVFWMLSFKPDFLLSFFALIKKTPWLDPIKSVTNTDAFFKYQVFFILFLKFCGILHILITSHSSLRFSIHIFFFFWSSLKFLSFFFLIFFLIKNGRCSLIIKLYHRKALSKLLFGDRP